MNNKSKFTVDWVFEDGDLWITEYDEYGECTALVGVNRHKSVELMVSIQNQMIIELRKNIKTYE